MRSLARKKSISASRRRRNDALFSHVLDLVVNERLSSGIIAKKLKLDSTTVKRIIKRCGTPENYETLLQNNHNKKRETSAAASKLFGTTKKSKWECFVYNHVKTYFPHAQQGLPVKKDGGYFWYIDIALIPEKIAIEVDGSYWHDTKFEKDQIRDNSLRRKGWKIYRFRYSKPPTATDIDKRLRDHNLIS